MNHAIHIILHACLSAIAGALIFLGGIFFLITADNPSDIPLTLAIALVPFALLLLCVVIDAKICAKTRQPFVFILTFAVLFIISGITVATVTAHRIATLSPLLDVCTAPLLTLFCALLVLCFYVFYYRHCLKTQETES